jgi:hypothetical protein
MTEKKLNELLDNLFKTENEISYHYASDYQLIDCRNSEWSLGDKDVYYDDEYCCERARRKIEKIDGFAFVEVWRPYGDKVVLVFNESKEIKEGEK